MGFIADFISPRPTADTLSNPSDQFIEALGGGRKVGGVRVNGTTALTLPAYFACLRNIAEDVAKLPLKTFDRIEPRGRRENPDHVANMLLEQPNPQMGGVAFRETLTHHAAGWGGGFAEIVRDGGGQLTQLWPIHPANIRPSEDRNRDLFWIVRGMVDGEFVDIEVPDDRMFHVYGVGSTGRFGYSVLSLAMESLGLSIAAQRFGASFFGNNMAIGGVLTHPGTLSQEALKHLRESYSKNFGGPENTGKWMILEEGMTASPRGIPPEEAQFLETREFQVPEICRWFRMPPHKIQHLAEATFNNIEHLSIEYVTDTLMPWLVRWESEIHRKLFRQDERRVSFVKHIVQGLLRGDQKARSEFYTKQFQAGAMSPNDIRELEDRNPVDGGDVYYVPANMIPADMAGQAEGNGGLGGEQMASDDGLQLKAAARIFGSVCSRLVSREVKAAQAAANKHSGSPEAFASWAERFYSGHSEIMLDHISDPMMSLVEILTGSPVGALSGSVESTAREFIARENADSVSAFNGGDVATVERVCLDWLGTKAARMADTLVDLSKGIADAARN